MLWGVLASAIFAIPALAVEPFVAPFKQSEWVLSGNARALDSAVELVHGSGQSGAVWHKSMVPYSEWTLEAILRTQADKSSVTGNAGYTLWYTSSPQKSPGNAHAATHGGPETWDGLAVMVDDLSDHSLGSVRGHLNDGTTKFSSLGDLSAESLSLCRIDYRSTESPILVRIGYSEKEGFVVTVNHQKCFLSTDIVLPGGYFGISANSDNTKDVLSVQNLNIEQGIGSDLVQHLPSGGSGKNAAKPAQPKQVAEPRQPAVDYSDDYREAGNAGSGSGISKEALQDILRPTADRIELMEVEMRKMQSALEQLSETWSLSLSELRTKPQAKGGPDVSELQKEIVNMRTQLADWRKAGTGSAAPVSNGISLWSLALVLVPVQLIAVGLYHGWLKRREQHEKLL